MAIYPVSSPLRIRRPEWPLAVKHESPQARNLVGCVQSIHGRLIDLVDPALALSGVYDPAGHAQLGMGLRFDGANERHVVATPARLQLGVPLSFDCWFAGIGTPSGNGGIFGTNHNSASNDPYAGYQLGVSSDASVYQLNVNSGGTFTLFTTTFAVTSGLHHLCATVSASARVVYLDGIAQGTTGVSSPTYHATSEFTCGETYGALGRIANIVFFVGRVWSRELTAGDVRHLYNPHTRWDLYRSPLRTAWVNISAATKSFPPIRRTNTFFSQRRVM